MKELERAELLDRCVEDVRAGRRTVADCLESAGDARAELERLLPLALSVVPPRLQSDPARKLVARRAFVAALAAERQVQPKSPSWLDLLFRAPHLRPAMLASSLALFVLTFGSVAIVGAEGAQPGDPLYPVKTGIEQLQVATARSPAARAEVRARIVERRLNEVQTALDAGKPQAADDAAAAYARSSQEARDQLEGLGNDPAANPIREQLDRIADQQKTVQQQAEERGAEPVVSSLETAAAVTTAAATRVPRTPTGTPTARPSLTATPLPPSATRSNPTPESEPTPLVAELEDDTPTPTPTPLPSATATPTASPSITATSTATSTPTSTVSPTATSEPTVLYELRGLIDELDLPADVDRTLLAHIETAERLVDRGQSRAAIVELQMFANDLDTLRRSGRITDAAYFVLYGYYAETVQRLGDTPQPVVRTPTLVPTVPMTPTSPPPSATPLPTLTPTSTPVDPSRTPTPVPTPTPSPTRAPLGTPSPGPRGGGAPVQAGRGDYDLTGDPSSDIRFARSTPGGMAIPLRTQTGT